MPHPLLRPLLIFEFLVAIEAIFTFWSQVGGQYHLDLMFWPWKFGLSMLAALLITAITAAFVKSGGAMTLRIWGLGTLLVATFAIAGLVTFYYHLHEPSDEDNSDAQTTITRTLSHEGHAPEGALVQSKNAPSGACPLANYHTRQEFPPRTIG
jgi:hypothetical protein